LTTVPEHRYVAVLVDFDCQLFWGQFLPPVLSISEPSSRTDSELLSELSFFIFCMLLVRRDFVRMIIICVSGNWAAASFCVCSWQHAQEVMSNLLFSTSKALPRFFQMITAA
jgi:hypothetical protein